MLLGARGRALQGTNALCALLLRSALAGAARCLPKPLVPFRTLRRVFSEYFRLSGTARDFPDSLGSFLISIFHWRSSGGRGFPLISFPILSEILRLFPLTVQGLSAALTSSPARAIKGAGARGARSVAEGAEPAEVLAHPQTR